MKVLMLSFTLWQKRQGGEVLYKSQCKCLMVTYRGKIFFFFFRYIWEKSFLMAVVLINSKISHPVSLVTAGHDAKYSSVVWNLPFCVVIHRTGPWGCSMLTLLSPSQCWAPSGGSKPSTSRSVSLLIKVHKHFCWCYITYLKCVQRNSHQDWI